MDAQTFFGYTSASSMYDARRHVNIVFQSILDYNFMLLGYENVVPRLRQVLEIRNRDERAAEIIIKNEFLNPMQLKYLNCLKGRNYLSDDEMTTILSCVAFTCKESRSPAGYSKEDNLLLLAHMMLATAFFNQEKKHIQSYYNNMMGLARGMRGSITANDFNNLMHITSEMLVTFMVIV